MNDPRGLTGREFEVMATLVATPKHGYAIMTDLRSEDSGRRVLGPGTLYRVLKDLAGRGLIATIPAPDADAEGPPRRYYQLTARGRRLVTGEARRLAGLLHRVRPLLKGEG